MRKFFCLALLVLMSVAPLSRAQKPAASPANDPVVGLWLFNGSVKVKLDADGTASGGPGKVGKWRYLNNPEVQRKYYIVWDQGSYTDLVVLDENNKKGYGRRLAEANRYPVLRLNED